MLLLLLMGDWKPETAETVDKSNAPNFFRLCSLKWFASALWEWIENVKGIIFLMLFSQESATLLKIHKLGETAVIIDDTQNSFVNQLQYLAVFGLSWLSPPVTCLLQLSAVSRWASNGQLACVSVYASIRCPLFDSTLHCFSFGSLDNWKKWLKNTQSCRIRSGICHLHSIHITGGFNFNIKNTACHIFCSQPFEHH